MNETELQDALLSLMRNLLDARDEIEGDDDDIELGEIARDMAGEFEELAHATSFADAELLTRDAGLVIRTSDGSEFQLTIVRSR